MTITPIIYMDGSVCLCQVIFAAKGITIAMAPESVMKNIPNLLISTTENGYQDGTSFFSLVMSFDKYLNQNAITRPVLLLSDGHSSRFNFKALKFGFERDIKVFLGPPDTTSVTQMLDQINAVLHTSYGQELSNFYLDSYINRETFMTILGLIWPTWVTKEGIQNAFKKCGVCVWAVSRMDAARQVSCCTETSSSR